MNLPFDQWTEVRYYTRARPTRKRWRKIRRQHKRRNVIIYHISEQHRFRIKKSLPIPRRFNRYDPVLHAGFAPVRLDCCEFDLVEVYQYEHLEGGRYGQSQEWELAEYEMCFVEAK